MSEAEKKTVRKPKAPQPFSLLKKASEEDVANAMAAGKNVWVEADVPAEVPTITTTDEGLAVILKHLPVGRYAVIRTCADKTKRLKPVSEQPMELVDGE